MKKITAILLALSALFACMSMAGCAASQEEADVPEGSTNFVRIDVKDFGSIVLELYPDIAVWYSFIEEGIFTRDMCLMDKQAAIEEFASGKTVFLAGGPEDYNQIYRYNPNMRLGSIPYGGKDDGSQLLLGGCRFRPP